MRYLTNNKEHLRYDEALASGWPIATGVVELLVGVEGSEAILSRARAGT
jgi:hypothetical protein